MHLVLREAGRRTRLGNGKCWFWCLERRRPSPASMHLRSYADPFCSQMSQSDPIEHINDAGGQTESMDLLLKACNCKRNPDWPVDTLQSIPPGRDGTLVVWRDKFLDSRLPYHTFSPKAKITKRISEADGIGSQNNARAWSRIQLTPRRVLRLAISLNG